MGTYTLKVTSMPNFKPLEPSVRPADHLPKGSLQVALALFRLCGGVYFENRNCLGKLIAMDLTSIRSINEVIIYSQIIFVLETHHSLSE